MASVATETMARARVVEPFVPMIKLKAKPINADPTIDPTPNGYNCSSSLEIAHTYQFVDGGVFNPGNSELANMYKDYKRVLAIVDHNVFDMYEEKMNEYFNGHGVKPTLHRAVVSEDNKSVDNMLQYCQYMTDFGILRREPVLVIGGGLITDVVGFSCLIYRRTTRYIRVPTTLVGLIDASVSNRVAVNFNGLKNRIGGYHEPVSTIIDRTFLSTIPRAEIRNGIAELIKIFCTTHFEMYCMLEEIGLELIDTKFATVDNPSGTLERNAKNIVQQGILSVLEYEIPNSREQTLDRVMYFGHTWSPVLELASKPELLHGHAISVDMTYSATLSYFLGYLPQASHARLLALFSKLGLALDHSEFTLDLLKEATVATTKTRDGKLRAPLPTGNLGTHVILPNIEWKDLVAAWELHKKVVQELPRQGLGVDATIDIRVGAGEDWCQCQHADLTQIEEIKREAVIDKVVQKEELKTDFNYGEEFKTVRVSTAEIIEEHIPRGSGWYGD